MNEAELTNSFKVVTSWSMSSQLPSLATYQFQYNPPNMSTTMTFHRLGLPTDEQGNARNVCIPWQTWKSLVREHDRWTASSPTKSNTKETSISPEQFKQSALPQSTLPFVSPTSAAPTPPPTKTAQQAKPPASASAKLPPGIVLDENGKPCKICNSWQTWAKIGKQQKKKQDPTAGNSAASSTSSTSREETSGKSITGLLAAASTTAATSPSDSEFTQSSLQRPPNCPPDVAELGRATWTFLHTTASHYPPTATPAQQTSMRNLINGVAEFYPCSHCAADFREKIKQSGGVKEQDVAGRKALERWFCERHNEVNEKLGKRVFDCAKVGERWRDGPEDGSCD